MGAMKVEKLVSIDRVKKSFRMLDTVNIKFNKYRMEMDIFLKKN